VKLIAKILCFSGILFAQQATYWAGAVPSFWGPTTAGWQVALFLEKPSYLKTEPLEVAIAVRNASSKSMRFAFQRSPWLIADFIVTRVSDEQKMQLRPVANSVDKVKRMSGGWRMVDLPPSGISRPGPVNLQELFALSPGTYTVAAKYKVPSAETAEFVLVPSNEVTIVILNQ
jgi:hypothetical protein